MSLEGQEPKIAMGRAFNNNQIISYKQIISYRPAIKASNKQAWNIQKNRQQLQEAEQNTLHKVTTKAREGGQKPQQLQQTRASNSHSLYILLIVDKATIHRRHQYIKLAAMLVSRTPPPMIETSLEAIPYNKQ